ncbi:MAG: ATP-binding cassette domain-containing protein [Desulfomonilaceae bacterium]
MANVAFGFFSKTARSISSNVVAMLVGTHLMKKFGGINALNDVDFELHPNEILGLIGPNGSGKTTLFNVM